MNMARCIQTGLIILPGGLRQCSVPRSEKIKVGQITGQRRVIDKNTIDQPAKLFLYGGVLKYFMECQ